jgi:GAF domain-containing protein
MSKSLVYTKDASKSVIYEELLPQIKALAEGEMNNIANMANITAVLKEVFGFFWVGFYLIDGNQLVVGPYQGSVACTRINKGKGVCGKSCSSGRTIIVPDVDKFEGHIACSSLSRSEIVVPVLKDGEVFGVLDIDSDKLDSFDDTDAMYLEKICSYIH